MPEGAPAFVNSKYLGVRASSPAGLGVGDAGSWWFRSDLQCFSYWDGFAIHNPKTTHGYVRIVAGTTITWFFHNLYTATGPYRNPLIPPLAANTFGTVSLTPLQDCGAIRWWMFADPIMVPEMLAAQINAVAGGDLWFSWRAEVDDATI